MRVDGEKSRAVEKARPAEAFSEALKKAPAKVAPKKPAGTAHPPPLPGLKKVVASPTTHALAQTKALGAAAITTESLGRARTAMNAQANLLQESRSEGQLTQEQKMNGRLLDLIVKELSVEFGADADRGGNKAASAGMTADSATALGKQRPASVQPSAAAQNGSGDPGNAAVAEKLEIAQNQATAKAKAAMALVERIEAFVKSSRPALAVTLGGALNARVEVERTGPGEVALKIQGTRGPPPADDLARIRDAVRAKGLKLSSISVG